MSSPRGRGRHRACRNQRRARREEGATEPPHATASSCSCKSTLANYRRTPAFCASTGWNTRRLRRGSRRQGGNCHGGTGFTPRRSAVLSIPKGRPVLHRFRMTTPPLNVVTSMVRSRRRKRRGASVLTARPSPRDREGQLRVDRAAEGARLQLEARSRDGQADVAGVRPELVAPGLGERAAEGDIAAHRLIVAASHVVSASSASPLTCRPRCAGLDALRPHVAAHAPMSSVPLLVAPWMSTLPRRSSPAAAGRVGDRHVAADRLDVEVALGARDRMSPRSTRGEPCPGRRRHGVVHAHVDVPLAFLVARPDVDRPGRSVISTVT